MRQRHSQSSAKAAAADSDASTSESKAQKQPKSSKNAASKPSGKLKQSDKRHHSQWANVLVDVCKNPPADQLVAMDETGKPTDCVSSMVTITI